MPIVVLPDKDFLLDALEIKGIQTERINMSILSLKHTISEVILFFLYFVPGIVSVIKLIKKYNIELVHSNTCHVLAGAIAAIIMKIPHVWHVHERDISPFLLRKLLARIILLLSQKVVTVSKDNTRQFFDNLHSSDKIEVISGGVDLSKFHTSISGQSIKDEFNISSVDKVIGMVGRITPWKGHKYFLEAASKVLKSYPHTMFLVVGDVDVPFKEHYKRDLIKYAKRQGILQHVIFTGFRKDIPEIISAFDILVHPSVKPEPFGLVITEAMALSKPVIATSVGGPTEIVNNKNTGILVPPKDSGQMANAICELLENEPKRLAMGENGRTRVESEFTWNKTLYGIEKIYHDLISQNLQELKA